MSRYGFVQAVARRLTPLLLGAAALILGLVAEAQLYSWNDTRYWLPDLVTGLGILACAGAAWPRARGVSLLLAATGATWFLGNFNPDLLYLHRGPLVHLLLTFPGWRSRSSWVRVSIAGGYLLAVLPVWRSELASVVAAGVVVGLVSVQAWTASPEQRHDRDRALVAAAVLSAALGGGAVARLAVPSGTLVYPTLLVYEAALVASAVLLASGARRLEQSQVVNLVVELGGAAPSGLRGALAEVLNDRAVEVGYRTPSGDYLDDAGRLVGPVRQGRAATYVEGDGRPVAVLLHDQALLEHPELVRAVSDATRLAAVHVQLRAELRAQLGELRESRRRLVSADDQERHRMRGRLLGGPGHRLEVLDSVLATALVRHPTSDHLRQADLHVRQAIVELRQLAAGLHSTELADGLAAALTTLAARSPVEVALDARIERLDPHVERTAYFVCAEALSNVVKHAGTDRAAVTAKVHDGRLLLTVADRGVGGANLSGRGLIGLADRLEAIGGTLQVTSTQDAGTQLTAEIPLGRQSG